MKPKPASSSSVAKLLGPDGSGHFGPYGGRFVPEVLMAPLEALERAPGIKDPAKVRE